MMNTPFASPVNVNPIHTHNREIAQRFLDALELSGEFLFALKPEPQGTPWPRGCPAHVYGKLEDVWPLVERFNNGKHRVGVFVVVNRHALILDGKGRPQRRGEHVTHIRAAFADADSPEEVARIEAALSGGPRPNMVVSTGRGRHYYWLLDDLLPDRFKLIQKSIAARFGTDPSVSDRARIMRLPGTRHVKADPKPVGCPPPHSGRISTGALIAGLSLRLDPPRPEHKPTVAAVLPEGFSAPPSHLTTRINGVSELGAGIVEHQIKEWRNAGLILAHAGRLAERDAWRDLILFPFSRLAHEFPEHEGALKAVFDEISAVSATTGANVSENEAQWDAQMQVAPREGGRTIGSTLKEAGEVSAVRLATDAGVSSLPPSAPSFTGPSDLIHGSSAAPVPPPPHNGPQQAFGGVAVPITRRLKPRKVDLSRTLPHRPWLLGIRLMRGEIALLAGKGARGKTSVALVWAASIASGRSLLGDKVFGGPQRVLFVSSEDNTDELERRTHAIAIRHKLTQADLDNLDIMGVEAGEFTLTHEGQRGAVLNEAGLAEVEALQRETGAALVVLDPLGPLVHDINDNGLMAALFRRLKGMATCGGFALLILPHNRKGGENDAEAIAGAAAVSNHARMVFAMESVSGKEEGDRLGLIPAQYASVFRIAATKANLTAAASDEHEWLSFESVTLNNAIAPYADGDKVGVVAPFLRRVSLTTEQLTSVQRAAVEAAFIRAVQEAQGAGKPLRTKAQGNSPIPAALDVLRGIVVRETNHTPADAGAIARFLYDELKGCGRILEVEVENGRGGRTRPGVIIGPETYEAPATA